MRSAVILAGGKSQRLGQEKAFIEFDNRPLISWEAETILSVADELIVVCRDEEHARSLEKALSLSPQHRASFTWDSLRGFGPVAGLEAGLRIAKGRFAFSTGCDLPFLNSQVIERLFELADEQEGYEAAVPVQPNGYFEPLHSVYHSAKMHQACERALEKGERRIHVPLQELVINRIPKDLLRSIDPELLCFFNLNNDEDLLRARALWPDQHKKRP